MLVSGHNRREYVVIRTGKRTHLRPSGCLEMVVDAVVEVDVFAAQDETGGAAPDGTSRSGGLRCGLADGEEGEVGWE